MDAADPPRIVFENTTSCADGHRAEMDLKQALSRARAPAAGWLMTVRIHMNSTDAAQADGEISDEKGAPVGRREFKRKVGDCDGLARAVGVWASLVLDAEIRRPRTASTDSDEAAESAQRPGPGDAGVAPAPKPKDSPRGPPRSPPDDTLSRDESATYEVGTGALVMSGIGGGNAYAFVGGTLFLAIAATKALFFRPAVALGQALEGQSSFWVAVRVDGCFRFTRQDASRRGLQVNLCGGVDVGAFDAAGLEVPLVSPGPSLELGAELTSDFSVLLRGITGFNTARDSRLDTPIYWGRAEFDLSWRLQ